MEDNIYIDEEFVKRYIESAVLPWEYRGELLDKLNELDNQLDHIDGMIEQGYSENYDEHYRLIREIEAVNKQIAATYETPADDDDHDDGYDDFLMYEQLRRGG